MNLLAFSSLPGIDGLGRKVSSQAAPVDFDVISVTETIFNSDVTSHPVSVPETVAGDLLLFFISSDGSTGVTTPSGLSLLYSEVFGTSVRGGCYAKISAGGAAGTVDFVTNSGENLVAQVYLIRGDYGTVESIVYGTPVSTNTGASSTLPTVAPFAAGEALYITALAWSIQYTATPPAGYGNTVYTISGSGTTSAMLSTSSVKKTTALESPGDYVMSTSGGARIANTVCVSKAQ